jgi:adenine deaminase
MSSKNIECNIVNIADKSIHAGILTIQDGILAKVQILDQEINPVLPYALPGFVDAHIHIESSMLMPSAFAKIAITHGTLATISDPHEIANVLGIEGIRLMVDNSKDLPIQFIFGAPSCVPATNFETAGAEIDLRGIEILFDELGLTYLSEMMNYPGVIYNDASVMEKIKAAKQRGLPVDGHAPGLRGDQLKKYIESGISTDHECFTYDEAKEKLDVGMKVIIREGSAAKNFAALAPLIPQYCNQMMFCSDDKHPDDLLIGHINTLVARAIKEGYDLFDVLRMACLNPVEHYGIPIGTLKEGDSADFIVVNNLVDFKVTSAWVKGEEIYDGNSISMIDPIINILNSFQVNPIKLDSLQYKIQSSTIRIIEAIDGELITQSSSYTFSDVEDQQVYFESNPQADILKIVVINRYQNAPPAIGFIKGFGIKEGAIASSVAHDCHNIVAVGTSDKYLVEAINAVISHKGGISAVDPYSKDTMPLPIAGIISTGSAEEAAESYSNLHHKALNMGASLKSPYMTLSFMALLVIPNLKLSDLGLFEGSSFTFVPVEMN